MRVTVVYCPHDAQIEIVVELPVGATVRDAIKRSEIARLRPEIDAAEQAAGVFGERVTLERQLENGDRVEIYRALIADPKTARRARAARNKN